MIPVIRARVMDIAAMKAVALTPVRNRGIYSHITLKLKSVSMVLSILFYGCAPIIKDAHHYLILFTL
jgi:hypothetical protein